jgi:hypothetical protein
MPVRAKAVQRKALSKPKPRSKSWASANMSRRIQFTPQKPGSLERAMNKALLENQSATAAMVAKAKRSQRRRKI